MSPSLGSGRKRTATSRRTSAAEKAVQSGVRSLTSRAAGAVSKRGRGLVEKLGAPAALTAGTVSLALAAGLASFAATTAVLTRIRDARERKARAAFEAAQGYRLARQRAEDQLGRPLTGPEHQELSRAFKARLAEIGYKP